MILKKGNQMKINEWIKDIVRIKIARPNKSEGLRLDCAERTINYDEKLFSQFLNTLTQEDFITYPSYSDYEELKEKIARRTGLQSSNITLGTGSDACIKDLIQLTCTRGSEIVSAVPCFPMYFVYGETFGAKFVKVLPNDHGAYELTDFMEAVTDETRLVILTNPNSPYGEHRSPASIEPLCKFLEERNIVMLIDEAYVDFSPGGCLELVKRYKNVLISRTFSKAWGAAGIRVGYLIANEALIELVSKIQLTYPLPGVSVKFASFLLDNHEEVETYIENTMRDRDTLCDLLERANYDVLRSHTNTIHLHEKEGDNSATIAILQKHGVAFKHGGALTGTMVSVPNDERGSWIRLSLGAGIQDTPFIKEILEKESL